MRLRVPRLWIWLALSLALTASAVSQPLSNRLESTIASRGGNRTGVSWSLTVVSLDTGETLASRQSSVPMKPASCLKILPAAVAMDLLGPDYRIPTTVYASGTRDGSTLNGDLWVLGLADPTYNGIHSDSASAALRNLADAIRNAGIRRVTGDLVITGLFVYADGSGATEALGRGADTLALSNDREDRDRLTPTDVGYARIVGQEDFIREANLHAGRRLRTQLSNIGVTIGGSIRTESTLHPPGIQIARRRSPPLESIVRRVLESSINLHADLLLLHLGAVRANEMRLSAGISVCRNWLAEAGADLNGFYIVDGSGLSHRNRVTARQLVTVLRRMDRSEAAEAWRGSLPMAGRTGTLAQRMRGTYAEGNMRAKTGTLTGAISLAGYVTDEVNGEDVAFAIVENSPYDNALGRTTARRIVDAAAVVIANGVPHFDFPITEDFRQPTRNRWHTQRGTTLISGIDRETPAGDSDVGRLMSHGPGQAMAVTGPLDTDNVAVEALVHLSYDTSVDSSPRVPYQGIVVRADGDNWIRFIGDFDRDRTLKIHAHINGEWQRLRTWTFPDDFPDPGGSGWHQMRLELRGNELTAFFDGNRLPGEPIRFSGRQSGRCGIYVWHWGGNRGDVNLAHFDEFRIEDLSTHAAE